MSSFAEQIFNTPMPKFALLAKLTNNALIFFTAVPAAVVAVKVVDFWSSVTALVVMFIADFATGLMASYFDWKKSAVKDKWFFGRGEGFSSDKFKKMFAKLIIYLGTPLAVHKFQSTYMIRNFRYETISEAEFGIATFLILIFCANEGYSIFHENLPRCGINVFNLFKRVFSLYKSTKKEIES